MIGPPFRTKTCIRCPKCYDAELNIFQQMQVRLCRAKNTGEIFAMKKLKKSEMLSRGQVKLNLMLNQIRKTAALRVFLFVSVLFAV